LGKTGRALFIVLPMPDCVTRQTKLIPTSRRSSSDKNKHTLPGHARSRSGSKRLAILGCQKSLNASLTALLLLIRLRHGEKIKQFTSNSKTINSESRCVTFLSSQHVGRSLHHLLYFSIHLRLTIRQSVLSDSVHSSLRIHVYHPTMPQSVWVAMQSPNFSHLTGFFTNDTLRAISRHLTYYTKHSNHIGIFLLGILEPCKRIFYCLVSQYNKLNP
jgi:hypothetical protein